MELTIFSREPKNEFSLQGKLGLLNYGDSSFVNSIIQALSNIEQICFMIRASPPDYVRSVGGVEDKTERKYRSDIVLALRKVLHEMWTDKRVVITPAVLIRRMNRITVLKEAILNTSIEDTYIYLMEALHESFQQTVPPHFEPKVNLSDSGPVWLMKRSGSEYAYQRSFVSDSVQGVTMLTTVCPNCGEKEETMDPFLFLKIDLVRITGQGHLNKGGFRENSDPALSSFSKKSSRKIMRSQESGRLGQAIHWMRALSMARMDSLGPVKKQQSMGSEAEDSAVRENASEVDSTPTSLALSTKLRQLSYSFVTRFRQSDVQAATPDNSNRVATQSDTSNRVHPDGKLIPFPLPGPPIAATKVDVKTLVKGSRRKEPGSKETEKGPVEVGVPAENSLSTDVANISSSPTAILPSDQLDMASCVRSKLHPEGTYRAPSESKECDGGDHTTSCEGSADGNSSTAGESIGRQASTESREKKKTRKRKRVKRTPSDPSINLEAKVDDENDLTRASSGSLSGSAASSSSRANGVPLSGDGITRVGSKPLLPPLANAPSSKVLFTPPRDDVPSSPVQKQPITSLSLHTICTLDTDADILNTSTHPAIKTFTQEEVLQEGPEEQSERCRDTSPEKYDENIRVDESLTEEDDERSAKIPFRRRRNSSIRMQLSMMSPRDEAKAKPEENESSELQTAKMSIIESEIEDDNSFVTIVKNLPRTFVHMAHAAKIEFGIRGLGSAVTLSDCLKQHFSPQTTPQYCPRCDDMLDMKRTKHIATAPEVLVIYFNRFVNMGFHHSKINSKIEFPINNFDLRDHLDSSSGYFQSSWQQNPVYNLAVVIEHAGTNKYKSQYNTLARHMPEDIWFEYEDHLVKQVSERYVRSREALMLFYVKCGPPKDTTSGKFHPPLVELQRMLKDEVVTRWRLVEEERTYLKHLADQERDKLRRFGIMHVLKYWRKKPARSKSFGSAIRRFSDFSRKSIANLARRSTVEKTSPPYGRLKKGSKWKVVQNNMKDIAKQGKEARMKEVKARQEERRKQRDPDGPLSPRTKALDGIRSEIKATLLGRLAHERGEIDDFDEDEYDNALKYVIPDTPPKKTQVFISLYWIMRFLSFSDPGPICNDDIACPHGHLKPHLHACKKLICIPVDIGLWKHIEIYLYEQYSYAIHNNDNMENVPPSKDDISRNKDLFRPLLDMEPCAECMEKHAALMDRRSNEMERVVIENILDGYEDPLPEETNESILREVHAELKKRDKFNVKVPVRDMQAEHNTTLPETSNDLEALRRKFRSTTGIVRRISAAWISLRRKTSPSAVSPDVSESSEAQEPLKNWFDRKSFRLSSLGKKKQLPSLQDGGKGSEEGTIPRTNSGAVDHMCTPSSDTDVSKTNCDEKHAVHCDQSDKLSDDSSEDPICRILQVRPLQDVSYCCIVHKPWLDRWRLFVQAGAHEDIEYPQSPPGPISNFRLLRRDSPHRQAMRHVSNRQSPGDSMVREVVLNDHLLADLRMDIDYVVVSPGVWKVLSDMYDGGPPIFRCDVNIYSTACDIHGDIL